MNLTNHHIPSTKYFTFFYWNKTEKIILSALKHGRLIFEPSYSENIYQLIRNINRVYFLVANFENHQIEAIIKLTDYKNDIMKFELKTKCSISFNEIEDSKEFKNRDVTILQRKLNVVYLPVFEAEVSEVYEREIEMFEDIREIMKEKYRQNKKQQETLATYDKIKNTPLMYQLLSYHQLCYAVQNRQMNKNQQGQLPPVFQIPGVLNYYQNDNNNNKGGGNNNNNNSGNSNTTGNGNGGSIFGENEYKYNTQLLPLSMNNEPRERYFDLKELANYNELEKTLRKDPNDDTAFYLSSNQLNESNCNAIQIKKTSREKPKEKKESRSRSRSSHNNNNSKTPKTKISISFNRSDSEEGFYAKKMMNQNKKTKYQYSSMYGNKNNGNTIKQQEYQKPKTYQQEQQKTYQQQQQSHQQYQQQQKRQPSLSNQEFQQNTKQQSNTQSTSNSYNNNTQIKASKITTLNTQTDVNIIDVSNRKKIILNRDNKNQPEIRINYTNNKYYK